MFICYLKKLDNFYFLLFFFFVIFTLKIFYPKMLNLETSYQDLRACKRIKRDEGKQNAITNCKMFIFSVYI